MKVRVEDFPYPSHIAREFSKRQALSEAQNHRCAYCGVRMIEPVKGSDRQSPDCATIDEIFPRAKGGKRIWSNQCMACKKCNEAKGDMPALAYFNNVCALGRDGAARHAARAKMLAAGGRGARKVWAAEQRKENERRRTEAERQGNVNRPVVLPRRFLEVDP